VGFSRADRRLLAGLSRQAAVAVHGVLLGRDLQHSRELLVSAREEERRRLRRDLHDGVGPALAAAALQVETARDVYPRDPEAADAILDRASLRLRAVVDDVRAAVHGLRPATLDDLGLPGALAELAGRFDAPGRSVTAVVTDVPGRSAAVDAAAYLVAAEAVTNATRHAAASRVCIELRPAPHGLVLTVTDDGRGLPEQPVPGVGLRSMRERAEELAGTLVVRPAAKGTGTTVELWLPVEVQPAMVSR
jgi:signal transduction histidine kinase